MCSTLPRADFGQSVLRGFSCQRRCIRRHKRSFKAGCKWKTHGFREHVQKPIISSALKMQPAATSLVLSMANLTPWPATPRLKLPEERQLRRAPLKHFKTGRFEALEWLEWLEWLEFLISDSFWILNQIVTEFEAVKQLPYGWYGSPLTLGFRTFVCVTAMQSDDVFPISRYSFQQLEEGDAGDVELLPAEPESLQRLGFWQRCGVRLLCLLLVCYFLPMLSFIPLALFGGIHMPSPWAGDYNHEAPTASIPSKD
eukprot:Skav228559  [mRNA]  locus=scaffold4568:6188:8585:+ [translate_table: standard]